MSSYDFTIEHPDNPDDNNIVGIHAPNPDTAVTIVKRMYPKYDIKNITVQPDKLILEHCNETRQVILSTPVITLRLPDSWNLNFAPLLKAVSEATARPVTNNSDLGIAVPFEGIVKYWFLQFLKIARERIDGHC